MKLREFEHIVDVDKIGEPINQPLGDFLAQPNQSIQKSGADKEKSLLLAIDVQNDFMDSGALGVPGAKQDMERLLHFMYNHFEDITHVMASIDTHKPQQIFHPCWWEDAEGNEPEPLTIIEWADIKASKWKPRFFEQESKTYVQKLEERSKKQLCIWPYHCIQGSYGISLEGQFTRMAYLHSLLRDYELKTVVKGEDPLSEMYGIIQPEYSERDLVRRDVIEQIKGYDNVIIAGQAKSHCVIESVKQIVDHLKEGTNQLNHIHILTDCMSSIPGFEEETEEEFAQLEKDYGIQLLTSNQW
ncbi:Nicotinamidase-related amidase [Salinibacillus kushneri]|uniref:Nicotinamidase-related amidase n=1 Tax=Salinibacillus kushneri TaxID=237682 RepID=A0A1I0BFX4_9BACI|nr:hypothetical protein [Salinibacillus kushneri]SET05877.1 Nicotinamidase-related amidase [Salinibacillus kushneri]